MVMLTRPSVHQPAIRKSVLLLIVPLLLLLLGFWFGGAQRPADPADLTLQAPRLMSGAVLINQPVISIFSM